MEKAAQEARQLQQGYTARSICSWAYCRQNDCGAAAALREAGADLNDIYTEIMAVFGNPGSNNRSQTGTARSTIRRADARILDQYSRNLTELAAAGRIDPVVGRGNEIRRAIQILSRRSKNNPVLVGEPGGRKNRRSGWAWPFASAVVRHRRSLGTSVLYPLTFPLFWPAPSTVEILRSGSSLCSGMYAGPEMSFYL